MNMEQEICDMTDVKMYKFSCKTNIKRQII